MLRTTWLAALVACAPGNATIADSDEPGPDRAPTGAPGIDTAAPTDSASPTLPEDTATEPLEAPDYRQPGPYPVLVAETSVQASCDADVTTYRPDGAVPAALVVLAHGFARGPERMEGWARHWASWGLAVATPELCHASFFDTDHEQNGQDLVVVGGTLSQGGPVLYAGHSAGALAALLAAAADPAAVAHLGLDLTDADDLALAAAPALAVPSWALLAEPSACNASGNGEAAYAAVAGAEALRVVGSDHCDFENPTDWGCTTFCSEGDALDEDVEELILGLSTGAVLGATGADPLGLRWWTPGSEWWDLMTRAGAITPL